MQKGKLTMICTKLTRSVFLVLAVLFASSSSAQGLFAVANRTEPTSTAPKTESSPAPKPQTSSPHKLGPLDLTVNWRFRTEAWDWFEPPIGGQNAYPLDHSLLRLGLGQKSRRFEWFIQGAPNAILHLPIGAVPAGRQGQPGPGG